MTVHLIKNRLLAFATLLLLGLGKNISVNAQDGKALFSQLCASCHNPYKRGTGPALYGALQRQPDEKLLKSWIKNNLTVLQSGNKYYNDLWNEYSKTAMTVFAQTPDADIDAIVKYIKDIPPPPTAGGAVPEGGAAVAKTSTSNTLFYGVATLLLAVLALILLQVNSYLSRLAAQKKGIATQDAPPFWRHTTYIGLFAVALFLLGGFLTAKGAIESGRSKDYQPEQPIYYSHKVHAGLNQINCLYCHGGAEQGKHANIPSVNICMNCHKGINEYAGPKIISEDGNEVDGTAEIQKLYKYAGYDGKNMSGWRVSDIKKPIEWVRIHNLPDHVYFNHAQHVKAGKVQCQTCHGPIHEMHEVKQQNDLSMGWCINCHRESKVQFTENNYYAGMYEKWHSEMKKQVGTKHDGSPKFMRDSSVTVEMIGGTECQKCHY
jgi:mono/diheme cytochrome c family protein